MLARRSPLSRAFSCLSPCSTTSFEIAFHRQAHSPTVSHRQTIQLSRCEWYKKSTIRAEPIKIDYTSNDAYTILSLLTLQYYINHPHIEDILIISLSNFSVKAKTICCFSLFTVTQFLKIKRGFCYILA